MIDRYAVQKMLSAGITNGEVAARGSVENLVGFVKRSFFRARRSQDAHDDLTRQLLEWLVMVNDERVCAGRRARCRRCGSRWNGSGS